MISYYETSGVSLVCSIETHIEGLSLIHCCPNLVVKANNNSTNYSNINIHMTKLLLAGPAQ